MEWVWNQKPRYIYIDVPVLGKKKMKNKKNLIAKDLFTKKYKIRIVKPKKGKGSFKRKKK